MNERESTNPIDLDDDMELAVANLNSAIERIENVRPAPYPTDEILDVTNTLQAVFRSARPHFIEGREHNPISHHTQVLDNMVRICLGQHPPYRQFKNAAVLALLHDIGNAACQRAKIKTDKVLEAFRDDPQNGAAAANAAISFRLEHMDLGPELARSVLEPHTGSERFSDVDMHFICRAIAVHDYPSIAMLLKYLADNTESGKIVLEYEPADFLLRFDSSPLGQLIQRLREAARLFMLTEQGVIKDLRDANAELTADNVLATLEANAARHIEEFELYKNAARADGFLHGTLYRTHTGYDMFVEFRQSLRAKWKPGTEQ